MKKLYPYLTALFLYFMLLNAKGDENLDLQFRIPFHLQYSGLYTNSLGNFGLAAWNIFSDVTEKHNKGANFFATGPLWQYGEKGSWLEIMGGFKRNENGYNDPAIDIRLFDRTLPRLNLAAEISFFPRQERRRIYGWLAADTPIPFGGYQARVGLESEGVVSLIGKRDSFSIGPRIVLPLPFVSRISPHLSSSLTTTYQFRNDGDFVRCYLGFTYKFGKK